MTFTVNLANCGPPVVVRQKKGEGDENSVHYCVAWLGGDVRFIGRHLSYKCEGHRSAGFGSGNAEDVLRAR